MEEIYDMHRPHPCHPLRPGNLDYTVQQINAMLKFLNGMMVGGSFYNVVTSEVYEALAIAEELEAKIYVISEDGETVKAVYFKDKFLTAEILDGSVTGKKLSEAIQQILLDATAEYEEPVVTLSYPSAIDKSGGSVSPELSYTQVKKYTDFDGVEHTETLAKNNLTPSLVDYKETTHDHTHLNDETGVVTAEATTSTTDVVIAHVYAKVVINGRQGISNTAIVKQVYQVIDHYNYGAITVDLNYNKTTVDASGASLTATYTISQQRTPVFTDGTKGNVENVPSSEFTLAWKSSNATAFIVNKQTGNVTVLANTGTARSATIYLTVTNENAGLSTTDAVGLMQEASSKTIVSTEYGDITISLDYSSVPSIIPYTGGTYSATIIGAQQLITVKYSDGTTTTGYEEVALTLTAQNATVTDQTNGTINVDSNTDYEQRTITLTATASAHDKTASKTLSWTQAVGAIAYYGSSAAAPTLASELVNKTIIPVTELTVAEGYKCEWVAIPTGHSITKWVDGLLKQEKSYVQGGVITKDSKTYTVYHSTVVIDQTVSSLVTII